MCVTWARFRNVLFDLSNHDLKLRKIFNEAHARKFFIKLK